jgi:pyruvate dehydrogenase E1 component alpha subunit
MEITCDNEYKARTIRGFCHLYDGQEAIGTGVNAALDLEDSWITSYRCHCIALARGGTVEGVLAELMGNSHGQTGGKGGSMHFYNKEHNFYGGQGIVGAQVPVGTGLAFANKYKTPLGEKMPVAIGCYGDGAANQGQIWEAANMAALWKLPMIFCIENNQYGMGTSISRSSCNNDYYTMGNVIPGLKMDGMNVLSVREGIKFVKDYVSSGNGPMFVEMSTYRYHGHSMSDPGTTYRNRDEIAAMRQTRDPIEFVKKLLLDHTDVAEEELKAIEKDIRAEVAAACERAKAGSPPDSIAELTNNIFLNPDGTNAPQEYIRMPDYTKSIRA